MRIDVHAHLFGAAYIDGLRQIFGKDSSPVGQDAQRLINWMSTDPRMTDLDGRLEEMEKWKITIQVLSVPFHGALVEDKSAALDLTQMANDVIVHAARAYPDRFRVLLAVPLQFPELALQENDRFAGQLEVVGVALMGSAAGRPLNSPEFMPFYGELERRRLPFLLHPISPPGLDCMLELNLGERSWLYVRDYVGCCTFGVCRDLRAASQSPDDFPTSGRAGALPDGTAAMGLRKVPCVQRKHKRAARSLLQALLLRYGVPECAGAAHGFVDVRD
jgi:hypothetical protein